jgi:hypothetical protein
LKITEDKNADALIKITEQEKTQQNLLDQLNDKQNQLNTKDQQLNEKTVLLNEQTKDMYARNQKTVELNKRNEILNQ